jgi:hypothetical protein
MTFTYPLLYIGPKPVKVAEFSDLDAGTITFQQGPLSEQLGGLPYADVNEHDGRYLVKRFPDLFVWPEGTQFGPQVATREEHEALAERVAKLEAALADLLATDDASKPTKGRKPAQAAEAPEVKADAAV